MRYASVGNPNLKPERGTEIEMGFEASLLDDLFGVDMTYYNKKTKDALMQLAIAPSTGFVGNQLVNLGTIANSGFEMIFNTAPIRRPSLTVEATVTLATSKNTLVSFGDNRAPIIFGSYAPSQRYQVGYRSVHSGRSRCSARGRDDRQSRGRPVLDTASVYMGPSVPTREMAFTPSVRLFDRLRLRTLFDYKSGHYQFNVKDWRRDRALVSWETVDPAANADEVLVRSFASQTFLHIQKADFLKLRDVSASYDLPVARAKRFVDRATVTVAGHNLKVWTKYGGADPEVNFNGVSTFNRNDSWTVPMTRRYSASLSVNYDAPHIGTTALAAMRTIRWITGISTILVGAAGCKGILDVTNPGRSRKSSSPTRPSSSSSSTARSASSSTAMATTPSGRP